MTRRAVAIFGVVSALALLPVSCAQPPSDSRYVQQTLPDAGTFGPVAELLVVRCGSLLCHGTTARNMRLYGSAGLRWSQSDRPFVPTCDTRDEVAQDYESVVGLEPERMAAVAAGTDDPGALTMVRKARGVESHKGGPIWTQGDDSDTCLVSWLTGAADAASCTKGLAGVVPGGNANPLLSCPPVPAP